MVKETKTAEAALMVFLYQIERNCWANYSINDSIDLTIQSKLLEKEQRMIEIIASQEIPLISENMNYGVDLDYNLKAMIRD